MKKKFRILISLFIATLLLSLPISSLAYEPIEPIPWTYNEDGSLYNGSDTFVPCYFPFGYKLAQSPIYYYSSNVEFPDEYEYLGDVSVVSYAHDGKVVWLRGGFISDYEANIADVFVLEEYAKEFNSFFDGDFAHLCIENSTHVSDKFSEELISDIKTSSTERLEIQVSELLKVNYTIYPIRAYDETRAVYFNFGQIIKEGRKYYFLDYSELDNFYFNADGSFSYRSGSVSVYVINEGSYERIEDLIESLTIIEKSFDYEIMPGDMNIGFSPETSLVVFWICVVLFGFIAPLTMMFFGFYLPKTQKRRGERRWRVMVYAAIPWLIASVILAVIIIIS